MALTRTFSDKLAKRLGASPDYVWEIVSRWAQLEGTGAKHNPLATTQTHSRSIAPWNDLGGGIGVQQYADEDAGVEATYQTLVNGYYDNIVSGLKTGQMNWDATEPEFRTWSGRGYGAAEFGGVSAQPSGSGNPLDTPLNVDDGGIDMQTLNKQIEEARKIAESLQKKFNAGDPNVFIEDVTAALANYHELVGLQLDIEADNDDRARQSFSDSIALGDYQQGQAESAYNRYLKRKEGALVSAETQIAAVKNRNMENADVADAFARNPSSSPVPEGKTYIAPRFEDALAAWEKKWNVGEEPSQNPADYPGPALPQYGSTGSSAPATASSSILPTSRPTTMSQEDQDEARARIFEATGKGDYATSRATVFQESAMVPDRQAAARERIQGAVNASAEQRDQMAGLGKKPRWWQRGSNRPGIMRFAGGTNYAPGGKAMVGEKGQETLIRPDGSTQFIGQWGPEVMDIEEGSQVLPNDVPPEEALAYSQIQGALKASGNPMQAMADAEMRRNDPELQQKVLNAMMQAIAANDGEHPPMTPRLAGNWSKYGDPWADWRPLTGVMAQEQAPQGVM